MTTVQDLIDETRRHLHGGLTDNLNVVSSNVSANTDNINVSDDLVGIAKGSIVEVGLEQMYVRSTNATNKSMTVIRGQNGTVPTSHAAGAVMRVNPSYPTSDLFDAVIDEISSLKGSGLYQFRTVEFSYDHFDKAYDLDLGGEDLEPLFVHSAVYEKSERFSSWAPTRVELLRNMDVTDFPSGFALKVVGRPNRSNLTAPVLRGTLIRATLTFSIGVPSALTDDVADCGVTDYIKPIIPVGAAWRQVLGKEARRLNPDRSHGSRRAEEIQPGSISFLGRALQGMKYDLLQQALELQFKLYPLRTDV